MSALDKSAFKNILEQIVEGFEADDFKAAMSSASAVGDPMAIANLAMGVQARVFASHGLDPAAGTAAFKAAGRQFALEPDIGPLLARMKSALG